MFDHEINLNADSRVTIMFGPNGIGKTYILRMTKGLLSSDFRAFKVPFSEFRIDFDDGSCLKVTKELEHPRPAPPISYGEALPVLIVSYRMPGAKERSFPVHRDTAPPQGPQGEQSYRASRQLIEELQARIEDLIYMGDGTWAFQGDEGILNWELYQRLIGKVPEERLKELLRFGSSGPEWFRELQKEIPHPYLIDTKRLGHVVIRERQRYNLREERVETPTVKLYADELAKKIKNKAEEYGALSQRLDSEFPKRVIGQVTPFDSTSNTASDSTSRYNELRNELEGLRKDQTRLKEMGLLVGVDLSIPEEIENQSRREVLNGVLTVYVRDLRKKLEIFNDLAERIELLNRNINGRFSFKKLRVTKDEGFVFDVKRGQSLSAEALSSGEQHELVLNYELLFKIDERSLVLIDEPELSLHIAWQHQFMQDLLDIARLGQFDVLVATHSPDIIHTHWDLATDLGEGAK